jgi:Ni,Fe-hydrogenase I cytochrome b subunit
MRCSEYVQMHCRATDNDVYSTELGIYPFFLLLRPSASESFVCVLAFLQLLFVTFAGQSTMSNLFIVIFIDRSWSLPIPVQLSPPPAKVRRLCDDIR